MNLLVSFLLVATFFVSSCAAIPPGFVLHEERYSTSAGWVKRDRVEPQTIVLVSIGLVQNNLHMGEGFLMDVSDPDSPNYGKHWTQEEVISKFAPSEETIEIVKGWLHTAVIDLARVIHHENKSWLLFHARIDELERLTHSKFFDYEHTESGALSVGCEHYYLPADVSPHIDYITPGVKLSAPLKKRKMHSNVSQWNTKADPSTLDMDAEDPKTCYKRLTPACIRALYNIPAERPRLVPNGTFGVYENGETWDQKNLDLFFTKYAPYIPNGTHPITDRVDGGLRPLTRPNIHTMELEALLDVQMAYPILYPNKIVMYDVDDHYYDTHSRAYNGLFNTWLDALDGSYCHYKAFGIKGDSPIDPKYPDPHKGGYKGKLMCGVYKPATVMSISYGVQEANLPENYQKRQCNEFLKLGLQGITITKAAGDFGVAGIPGYHGNKDGCMGNGSVFNPTLLLCPYITLVGGTQLAPHTLPSQGEVAVFQGIKTGGGFSNIYPRPKYQDALLDTYFQNYKPPYKSYAEFGIKDFRNRTGVYNRLGRGIPDVAAAAYPLSVVSGLYSRQRIAYGTSASAPIFGAVISRINGERISAGKAPVGFVNPVLYKHPEVLNDITSGDNPGCNTKGFSAVPGWDPVTGLGTPNYKKMLKLFMSLP